MNDCFVLSAEKLHDFAKSITKNEEKIEDLINDLYLAMQVMNEQWGDGQNNKFVSEFVPHLKNINELCDHLKRHAQFVKSKAIAIDEYNKIGYRK